MSEILVLALGIVDNSDRESAPCAGLGMKASVSDADPSNAGSASSAKVVVAKSNGCVAVADDVQLVGTPESPSCCCARRRSSKMANSLGNQSICANMRYIAITGSCSEIPTDPAPQCFHVSLLRATDGTLRRDFASHARLLANAALRLLAIAAQFPTSAFLTCRSGSLSPTRRRQCHRRCYTARAGCHRSMTAWTGLR